MSSPTIEDIIVKDLEKRKVPSKHYAYIIEVQWSDGTSSTIGRQYSSFFDFQMTLLEQFPIEGGQNDPSSRIIPFLPGKVLFRRSNTRDMALKRMGPIAEYCTGIAKMPKHISESDTVLGFFEPGPEDEAIANTETKIPEKTKPSGKTANKITGPLALDKYVAIAEYKKEDRKQLSLKEGEVVEVVEKKENGWWLAANEDGMSGWVPGVYLEALYGEKASPIKKRLKPGEGEKYVAIAAFEASCAEEMSFRNGEVVEILEKNLEGWWYARKDGDEGWVPTTYLQKFTRSNATNSNGREASNGYTVEVPAVGRYRQNTNKATVRPPPKRSSVRRTLTKAAAQKVQTDFNARLLKQESLDDDDEEFAGVYTTVGDFTTTIRDGISFSKNETVYVTQKSEGWWYGRIGARRGWVPATYLEETNADNARRSALKSSINSVNSSRPPLPPSNSGRSTAQFVPGTNSRASASSTKPARPQRPPTPKSAGSKSPFSSPKKFGFGPSQIMYQNSDRISNKKTSKAKSPSPNKLTPTRSAPLTDYDWYKDISRQEAEDALAGEEEEGYFIVRPSQRGAAKGKPFSLTLFHKGTSWNFHIRRRSNDQKYAVGAYKESEPCFLTLPELVEHYSKNPMLIGEDEARVVLVDSPNEFYSTC